VRRLGDVDAVVSETEGEPTRLIDTWDGAVCAIVVDASLSGAPPGTVHRVDATAGPLPYALARGSTHHFSLGDTIELARALHRLPALVVVYGIEGASFEPGEGLSEAAERGVRDAVQRVREEVRACTNTH
jgi:hydrogenase maturation protease